jgi:hypothetical protein
MRTILPLSICLLLTSIVQAQEKTPSIRGTRTLSRIGEDSRIPTVPRLNGPPLTFLEPDGRPPAIVKPDTEDKIYFDRFVVSHAAPGHLFATPGAAERVEVVCEVCSIDRAKKALHCTGVDVIKAGNLALTGERVEATGDLLTVIAGNDKEAVLYRLSSNRFGAPVEQMRGKKIVVDLKAWSATADDGDEQKFDPSPLPRKSVPPIPPPFDRK